VALDASEHVFDTGCVEYVKPPPPWEAGRQGILNSTGARVPEHTFSRPVPVVVRICGSTTARSTSRQWRWAGPVNTPTCACRTGATGSPGCGSTPQM